VDQDKNGFRIDIKDFRYELNEGLLNLQDLFVFSDEEKYQTGQHANHEQLKLKKENILKVLGSLNDQEYEKTWKEANEKQARCKPLWRPFFQGGKKTNSAG
jgi:hypothetical protein